MIRATRTNIAAAFGTDYLTTDRILQNCGWGFFTEMFGERAAEEWDNAHPEFYEDGRRNYHAGVSIEFITQHLELFATMQFWTGFEWKKVQTSEGERMEPSYPNGYRTEAATYATA